MKQFDELDFRPQNDGAFIDNTFYTEYYKVYYVYVPSPEQALVYVCATLEEAQTYVISNGSYPYVIAFVGETTETEVEWYLTEPEA